MLVYDTLFEKKKWLAPIPSLRRVSGLARLKSDPLKMFVCGPTVYNYAHIGHAKTYVVFDIIARWLRHRGWKLHYLQNITDIDDKIPDLKTARRFEKEYLKDMKTLRVENVDRYARAGDHLPEIKKQIQTLLDKGFAYRTDSGIYFEVKKFPAYGQLSKQNLNQLRPGWRIEPDPQKKDPLDFALWKFSEEKSQIRSSIRQPADETRNWSFSSPWGRGRPGWHIEDTAITEKYFGSQYDLHGAAVDLKFPHHESEIAQEESISGKKPMVKIWLHAGFLLVNGEKMSKSLGNFITIRDFLKKYPVNPVRNSPPQRPFGCASAGVISNGVNILRLLIASHHYRSPINYTDKLAKQRRQTLDGIEKFMRTISPISPINPIDLIRSSELKFTQAMDDDFNTPRALATLFDFMAAAPKVDSAKQFVSAKLDIFGIIIKPSKIPAGVVSLLMKRDRLRRQKNFSEADKIRRQIEKQGFYVED